MKHFKKRGFWVFYLAIVLAGAFIIIALGLQNQYPVIPNVSAQQYGSSGIGGAAFAPDVWFTSNIYQGVQYGVSPSNVLFNQRTPAMISVRDVIFPVPIGPEKLRIGSGGKTEMRTIMTCVGCALTMSTCDWMCGVTYIQCGTGAGQGSMSGLLGGSYTLGTCPTTTTCGSSLLGSCSGGSYTFGTCPGTGFDTLMTCSGSFLCGPGVNTTFTTCRGGAIGCGIIGGDTLSTCIGCKVEPSWEWIKVGATMWQSCGTFQMHGSFSGPSGFSQGPAF